ncbi:MAG: hypothetical protein WC353_04470 [Candidatus Peribacter sp.]
MELDDLSAEDASWAHCLLYNLEQLQEGTLEHDDAESQEVIVHIVMALVTIRDLLIAYRQSPQGIIDGEGGVAQQLRLTKEQIFLRMHMFGLSPRDFHDPDSTLRGLLGKSEMTHDIERVLQANGQYDSFVAQEE